MFGNLVRIELIRLTRSRVLKASCLAGVLILSVILSIGYILMTSGSMYMDDGISPAVLNASVFTVSFTAAVSFVITVTVIYTTCDYRKFRLPVNIEGAVRNRFKLCLSELTGIAVFTALIDLLIIPGIFMSGIGNMPELMSVIRNGDIVPLRVYEGVVSLNMFSCLIVYLISKFTPKAYVSAIFSLLAGITGVVAAFVMKGFAAGYESASGGSLPRGLNDIILVFILIVPVAALITALGIRAGRTDRV